MLRASTSSSSAAELREQRAQIFHASVVDPVQALGDVTVAARPVPNGQLDGEVDRRGQLEELLQFGSRVGRLALDARDDVLDDGLLPGVEHLVEQRLAIGEVPVEATLGHPQAPRPAPRPARRPGRPPPGPAVPRRPMRRVESGPWPRAYLYGTVLTDASAPAYDPYDSVWIEDGMRIPNAGTRIPPLAHPRDRAGLHAGGRLGPSRARWRRGLPGAARADGFRRSGQRDVAADPRPVAGSATASAAGSASAGSRPRATRSEMPRAGCRFPGRPRPRWPTDCRTTCATRRRTWTSARCRSRPLYRTDTEFAAELSNQTVHGVMHLAWVDQGDGRYQGQMAVYVKPRGRFGKAYMALHQAVPATWIVYPALMRQIERAWALA